MSAASLHVAMIERRLAYLGQPEHRGNVMAQRESEALRWALPLLRTVAAREAQRPHLGVACPACSTPAGFICVHLPRRT